MSTRISGVFFGIALVAFIITMAVAQQPKGPGFSGNTNQQQGWYSNSIAFVVGINTYSNGWPSLSAATRDADLVAATLKAQGFKVYTLKNNQAKKSEIMRYLSDVIPPKLSQNDRFLFYFSGHGQTRPTPNGEIGYIIPVDGKRPGGQDQYSTYISMKQLRDTFVDLYAAKHVMVVADSCFSGLMTTKSTGVGSVASRAMKYKGRMILTAGGKDEQAIDGVFAPVLVDAINGQADSNADGAVTFGELSLYVQQNVAAKSRQRPVYGWWEGNGEMVFAQGTYKPRPPALVATPQPVSLDDNVPEGMVKIPGGWFYMGCAPDDIKCSKDERPRKRIFVDSFFMDMNEVTVADYSECVKSGECKAAKLPRDQRFLHYYNWNKSNRSDHPINGIDWHDANSYCLWKGKQLPSEAQFEYALRGGSDGHTYPWGNSSTPPSRYGNYADESSERNLVTWNGEIFNGYDDGYAGTAPVCSMQRNAFGLCDISGNLLEWCRDYYDQKWFFGMPQRNPINTQSSRYRVLRGSGWNDGPRSGRTSARSSAPTGIWNFFIGFRCVKDEI